MVPPGVRQENVNSTNKSLLVGWYRRNHLALMVQKYSQYTRRPLPRSSVNGLQVGGHKATRMQWCLSLQGRTPLFSW